MAECKSEHGWRPKRRQWIDSMFFESTPVNHQCPCGADMGRLHGFDHCGGYSGGDQGATRRLPATGRALQDTRFAKTQIPL
jgi:hypothetical protein